MRIGVWITLAALASAGCVENSTNPPAATNNPNKPATVTNKPAIGGGETPATSATPGTGTNTNATNEPTRPDNSGVNKRDADNDTILPTDQGSSKEDTDMVAEIRREVLKIENLSFNGRQAKIIVKDGKVTLRGPVASDAEKKAIEDVAKRIAKPENVTSALEVAP